MGGSGGRLDRCPEVSVQHSAAVSCRALGVFPILVLQMARRGITAAGAAQSRGRPPVPGSRRQVRFAAAQRLESSPRRHCYAITGQWSPPALCGIVWVVQLRDDDGRVLDAEFVIEPDEPYFAVIMDSRSGGSGGQDVVRVAVEVLASPVITHRGSWIGRAGSDLDVAQVNSGVEHGGDEGMAEHVRVWPGDPHPSGTGQAPQPAGGGVAVYPCGTAVEQDRAVAAGADRPVDSPRDGWWQRDQDGLGAFAARAQYRCPCSSPRSAMSAPVASKIRKPSSPSMATARSRTGSLSPGRR
jgi:hypothetical protein